MLTIRSGYKLIDFSNFKNNTFNVVTELTYKNGDEEFRPDLADDFLTNSPSFRDYAKNSVKELGLEFIEAQNKIHKLSKS